MVFILLYRPVGFKEMDLILDTGNRHFPERLPGQPIFYPVLNALYAREIAEKWNTNDKKSCYVGYVLEFEVDDEYVSSFEVHIVGSSIHKELWVLAEELDEFNKHIINDILIINAYYGKLYEGRSCLEDKNYIEQFLSLKRSGEIDNTEFTQETLAQWKMINENYFIWHLFDFSDYGVSLIERDSLINLIKGILIKNKKWFIRDWLFLSNFFGNLNNIL